jgi:hypothetical protein
VFVGVEAQRARQRVDDRRARPGLTAALKPGVVVDAHPGERRQFLATQARRATRSGASWQADVCRADPLAMGAQETAELGRRWLAHVCHSARWTGVLTGR